MVARSCSNGRGLELDIPFERSDVSDHCAEKIREGLCCCSGDLTVVGRVSGGYKKVVLGGNVVLGGGVVGKYGVLEIIFSLSFRGGFFPGFWIRRRSFFLRTWKNPRRRSPRTATRVSTGTMPPMRSLRVRTPMNFCHGGRGPSPPQEPDSFACSCHGGRGGPSPNRLGEDGAIEPVLVGGVELYT